LLSRLGGDRGLLGQLRLHHAEVVRHRGGGVGALADGGLQHVGGQRRRLRGRDEELVLALQVCLVLAVRASDPGSPGWVAFTRASHDRRQLTLRYA
jgi:hypothetical protein